MYVVTFLNLDKPDTNKRFETENALEAKKTFMFYMNVVY